jgi:hypothetical protein
MGIKRIGKHLLAHRWRLRQLFPPSALAAIEQAIKTGETGHAGQVRFVVEGALDGAPLFRGQSARQRAIDIFAQLRIWDTAHNNGVLIYLLLADSTCCWPIARSRLSPIAASIPRWGRPAGRKYAGRCRLNSRRAISSAA